MFNTSVQDYMKNEFSSNKIDSTIEFTLKTESKACYKAKGIWELNNYIVIKYLY